MFLDEKEPVAAPRDVAGDWSKSRHVDRYVSVQPVTRHVRHFDFSIPIQMRDNNADRRLDAMSAGVDAIQMRKRGHNTDGAMPAHPKVRNAVEKDHACDARFIHRWTQQRADNSFRATRFAHHGAAKAVVFVAETSNTIGKGIFSQIGATADDHAGRLTARV